MYKNNLFARWGKKIPVLGEEYFSAFCGTFHLPGAGGNFGEGFWILWEIAFGSDVVFGVFLLATRAF